MKKLIIAAILLTGCGGGGGETATPEPLPPQMKEYCVEIRVTYVSQHLPGRVPIQSLYGVAYPSGGSMQYLDQHQGFSYKRYKVSSDSNWFNVDMFMFNSFYRSVQLGYSDNDVVAIIDIDTVDGTQMGTTGINLRYSNRFDGINKTCN